MKQITAVAVAHLTRCCDCIKRHTQTARHTGAAYSHVGLMLATLGGELEED